MSEEGRNMNGGGGSWFTAAGFALTVLLQVMWCVWWSSGMDRRMQAQEEWRKAVEAHQASASIIASSQSVDIAIIKTQVADIKAWVDRQQEARK